MKKILFYLILLTCFLYSCSDSTFKIAGKLNHECSKYNGRFFYLYDLDNDTLIDSAIVRNNNFEFKLNLGPVRLVQISYRDTSNGIVFYRPIGFKNPYIKNTNECMFYIENIDVIFDSLFLKKHSNNNHSINGELSIITLQNIALYNNSNFYLITNRYDYFRNVELIKKHSKSVQLIKLLFLNKENFTTEMLNGMMLHFDAEVHTNKYYKLLKEYIALASIYDNATMEDMVFSTTEYKDNYISYKEKPYTLVVFWASWCAPCRKEIPALKKLYEKYNSQLNIISVSVDNDSLLWENALKLEKMSWQQLIVPRKSKEWVMSKFDLSAIPKIYLYTKSKLIYKNVGYDVNLENTIGSKIGALKRL